jgi:hypothetical protein
VVALYDEAHLVTLRSGAQVRQTLERLNAVAHL